tara:strand:+ start:2072 stop:2434 length:363 start_codon:yes stop_codon:yes gene_type:complete
MNTLINFIKGKSWVFLTTLLAALVFVFIDFPYFNEILHGVVKVGVLFLSLGVFRNLFFRGLLSGYVEGGQLHKDFKGEQDESLSIEERELESKKAKTRIATYVTITVGILISISLLLFSA